MPKFHFVEDYERYVSDLIATHPLDEAMALAVGGNYELFGQIEHAVLEYLGIQPNWTLVDLGCGSGRLASELFRTYPELNYTGIDIVKSLLEYAKHKAPSYRFILSRSLKIPFESASADCVAAFSLFTHLLHAETYQYMTEAYRALKPGGKLAFSFIEFAEGGHWHVFEETVAAAFSNSETHLNTFIERSVIALWASKIGFEIQEFVAGGECRWNGQPLGQTLAILVKPAEVMSERCS